MILVDINLLLYAVNRDDPQPLAARRWLEDQLSGTTPVALSWVAILGFIRLSTNSKVMPKPLSREDAFEKVTSWIAQPCVRIVAPGERHLGILKDLLNAVGRSTNWVTDAHFAALAIEHDWELYSADKGFANFPGLRWKNPLVALR